jgi:hypothetical protein
MSKKVIFYCISLIFILTILFVSKNLDTAFLWYDEAGQFFIAKGLNHDSDPLAKTQGITEVVYNNSRYNLDPGGFSIILHFWSSISNSHIWLRLLPFLFFIGTIFAYIYLSNKWLKNINMAILMGFIPILIPMVLKMGFEIRAYSMETLGTLLGIIAIEKFKNQLNNKHLIIWASILAVFITSRYSEIIIVFCVSLYIVYLIFTSKKTMMQKFTSLVVYSAPLLLSLLYIYLVPLANQNSDLKAISYLKYISKDRYILTYTSNLIYFGIIAALGLLFLFSFKYEILKKYRALLFVTVSVNFMFFVLSYLGKHPWEPYSNRCISMFLLVILCLSMLCGELFLNLLKGFDTWKFVLGLAGLVALLFIRKDALLIRFSNENTYEYLKEIELSKYKKIHVDRTESPVVRYLLEYGSLKETANGYYPERFTFAKFLRHGFYEGKIKRLEFYATQPKMNDYSNHDLMIAPELYSLGRSYKWKLLPETKKIYIKKTVEELAVTDTTEAVETFKF